VITSLLAKAMAFCMAGPPQGAYSRRLSSAFQTWVEKVSQRVAEHVAEKGHATIPPVVDGSRGSGSDRYRE
jgi:hypothetical protein